MDNLQYAKEVMPLYIDTAKTYAQTSVGALALTIAFKEKVLGLPGAYRADATLLASWCSYLSAIGSSALYQWIAVRWIVGLRNSPTTDVSPIFAFSWLTPHLIYGYMVVSFFAGSALLVVSSARQLARERTAVPEFRSEPKDPKVHTTRLWKWVALILAFLVVMALLIALLSLKPGGQE